MRPGVELKAFGTEKIFKGKRDCYILFFLKQLRLERIQIQKTFVISIYKAFIAA